MVRAPLAAGGPLEAMGNRGPREMVAAREGTESGLQAVRADSNDFERGVCYFSSMGDRDEAGAIHESPLRNSRFAIDFAGFIQTQICP